MPVPRVVYSLRGKNVCNIACGALHNVAVTSEGRVYTWGCNDDGAVGREGDEAVPMLVPDIRYDTSASYPGPCVIVEARRCP